MSSVQANKQGNGRLNVFLLSLHSSSLQFWQARRLLLRLLWLFALPDTVSAFNSLACCFCPLDVSNLRFVLLSIIKPSWMASAFRLTDFVCIFSNSLDLGDTFTSFVLYFLFFFSNFDKNFFKCDVHKSQLQFKYLRVPHSKWGWTCCRCTALRISFPTRLWLWAWGRRLMCRWAWKRPTNLYYWLQCLKNLDLA